MSCNPRPPGATLDSLRHHGVALEYPFAPPVGQGCRSVNVTCAPGVLYFGNAVGLGRHNLQPD